MNPPDRPSTLTPSDLQTLKHAVRIEQILSERGLLTGFRRTQDRLTGPCPLHGGDNPSAFVIRLAQNRWRCFTRCDSSGDVLDLLCRLEGGGPFDAARRLLRRPMESAHPRDPLPAGRAFVPFTRQLRLEPELAFLRQKGIEVSTARRFEAGLAPQSRWLAGCVAVRLHDPQGRPLGYAGRRLEPNANDAKWRFPPGLPKGSLLYGLHRVPDGSPSLVLTECPWSVMRLYQLGIPAVALLGVHLSSAQQTLLRPYRRLHLLLDGDPAGQQAQLRLAAQLEPDHEVTRLVLPPGLDPDDLPDEALRGLCGGHAR